MRSASPDDRMRTLASTGNLTMNRQSGFALAAALLLLVAVGALAVGAWTITDLNRRAAENRETSLRALQVAEAGAAHTLGLLRDDLEDEPITSLIRGDDGTFGTSDDGLLVGHGLTADLEVPASGREIGQGTYRVLIQDDPADGDGDPSLDSNDKVLATCRGTTPDGGSATVRAVIGKRDYFSVVTDGRLEINGSPELLGECGGAHANEIVVVSGVPTVENEISASDTVEVSGSINDPDGGSKEPLHHQPPIRVPDVEPSDYCPADADWVLESDGTLIDMSTDPPTTYDGSASKVFGWQRFGGSEVVWELSGNSVEEGTYCIDGNVDVSGSPDGPGGAPASVSLIATGSIVFSGNPTLRADHPDDVIVVSGGDVVLSGNPGVNDNFDGIVYAHAQCGFDGNPSMGGQVLCNDEPEPAGVIDHIDYSYVDGNPTVVSSCDALAIASHEILAWMQKVGN